jgi:hypothetical protein
MRRNRVLRWVGPLIAGIALVLVSSSVASAQTWRHVSVVRQDRGVRAVFSYEKNLSKQVAPFYRHGRLVVARNHRTILNVAYPFSAFSAGPPSLTLRNVWGDGLPEALVRADTGGNRCCLELGVAVVPQTGESRLLIHDFPGYDGWRGVWHNGRYQFVTADNRFDCAFASCADASQPIRIYAISKDGRGFVDVTASRTDLVKKDAASLWWYYRLEIKDKDYQRRGQRIVTGRDPMGLLAPWCADEYRLGKQAACHSAVADALDAGYLALWNARGVGRVYRQLTAWGFVPA